MIFFIYLEYFTNVWQDIHPNIIWMTQKKI